MKLLVMPRCCKLDTAVYSLGLCLTAVYLLLGLGSVVWFVLCMHDHDIMNMDLTQLYMVRVETMMGSLAVMGTILVMAFIGLLCCLLLILGVKSEQRILLLPWQLFHGAIVLMCFPKEIVDTFIQLYCGPNGHRANIFIEIWIKQSRSMVFIFNIDKVSLKKLFPTMNI